MGELVPKDTAPDESDELYYILGVPEDATPEEIRMAYKKAAGKHHPDKEGGDPLIFKLIKQAYEILIDPEKRQNYDATGIYAGEGVEKLKTARGTVEGMIHSIILDDSLELEYIDMVSEVKKVLAHNIKQCEKGIKKINKSIKRMNKYKKRAKVGLIRSVFDKNIADHEGARDTMVQDKEIFVLAIKITNTCGYDFDDKPQAPTPPAGYPGSFHVNWQENA